MNIQALRDKPVRFAIGLQAGGSLGGVEAALCRIKGAGPATAVKLIRHDVMPHPRGLRNRLFNLRKGPMELGLLHYELGEHLAAAAEAMRRAATEELAEVDFVAAQGLPIAHIAQRGDDGMRGGLMLGEPAFVAEALGVPVVSNFRARDMAAGGQGHPCGAYADHLLFARDDRTVATLHLGTFASLTIVPPASEEMMAFDVGPCNMAIDGALHLITSGNRERDDAGKRAGKGELVEELLDYLLEHVYFSRVPPKSASREDFGPEVYLRDALRARKEEHVAEDILATVTAAVAFSVTRAYTRFVKPHFDVARVILTGGGVHNKALVKRLRDSLPETTVRTSDHYGLAPTALDPLRAAILGNETLLGRPSNVPHATGAARPVVLGTITPP